MSTMMVSRRRRSGSSRSSSCSEAETVQVKGQAYLCFSEDGSWFQGYLSTPDDSSYTIRGKRIRKDDGAGDNEGIQKWCNHSFEQSTNPSTDRECISSSPPKAIHDSCEPAGILVEYSVTLVDHDTGSNVVLPKVKGRNGQLCTFQDQEVSFVTEHVYKGIKADMVIQKYLGSSLIGQNCHVFCGPMKISYKESLPDGKKWCL